MAEGNKIDNLMRAQVLVNALPYIKDYNGQIVVVKYGGNAMVSPELKDAVMKDIVLLSLVGVRLVLVHGGGPEINEILDRMGIESRFINGLRYTTKETMHVVQMVLCGKVNKNLVDRISRIGGRAVGLSGLDSALIQAKKLNRGDGEDYGLVGEIIRINPEVLERSMADGFIPIVATVAQAARPYLTGRTPRMDPTITTSVSPLGQQGMRGSEPFYRKGIGRIQEEDDE